MKNLNCEDLEFYGDAYWGEQHGENVEIYQYATCQDETYKVLWVFTKKELDCIEEIGELQLALEDIDRIERA